MDRLIANNTVPFGSHDVAPTSGTPGLAREANPGLSIPGTDFPAYAWNMLEEEIRNVLVKAGIAPSSADWTQLSQAITRLGTGRLLNVLYFFQSGTYVVTPGTTSIIVEVQGAGGAGGAAPATSSSQSSCGGPGAPGAYARSRLTGGFNNVNVTIGLPGVGTNGLGGNGGTTSFGSLLAAAGGGGGQPAGPTTNPTFAALAGAAGGYPPVGDVREAGTAVFPTVVVNSQGIIVPSASGRVPGAGAGGFGVANSPSQPLTPGVNGQQGLVIVWEYA